MQTTKLTPCEFVSAYYSYAVETERKTGIDARFTLAQAALETGWGASAPGNLFFGIKARPGAPENKRQLLRTREILPTQQAKFPEILSVRPLALGKYEYIVRDWFRKYDTPEESFTDHANFFLENKRYAKALQARNNPYRFAEAIAQAGYATDPYYANTLKKLIQRIDRVVEAKACEQAVLTQRKKTNKPNKQTT